MATRELEYKAYLRGELWLKHIRPALLARSGGHCERCGREGGELHVHHLTYARHPYPRLDDLRVVGKDCHDYLHGFSKYDPADHGPAPEEWAWTYQPELPI